jgi:ADP-ribose pyrophosphatase YjhB (NUDIX family)
MILAHPIVRRLASIVFVAQRGMTLGVRGIVIDEQRRVLLVRHGYAPGWHFPGGGVERRESFRSALERELREEAAVTLTGEPRLLGIYTNFNVLPRDHVAAFVIPHFTRGTPPPSSFEIREQGFFPVDALPEATTAGTRARLAEVLDNVPISLAWAPGNERAGREDGA